MLFGVRVLPPDAPPELHDLARLLAALAGPADPSELTGEAEAVAAFSRFAAPDGLSPRAVSPGSARHRRPSAARRPVRRTTVVKAVLGAAAMVAGVAAAYTGVLPSPIQQVAHITINAPPPGPRHPAVKPGQHGHTSPTLRPDSQPASPPERPASPTPSLWWPAPAPALPSTSASPSCEPGPWLPQDLRAGHPVALPSGWAQAHCPVPATSAPNPKATVSPSSPASRPPRPRSSGRFIRGRPVRARTRCPRATCCGRPAGGPQPPGQPPEQHGQGQREQGAGNEIAQRRAFQSSVTRRTGCRPCRSENGGPGRASDGPSSRSGELGRLP